MEVFMKLVRNRKMAGLAAALWIAVLPVLGAQIQSDADVVTPTPQFQDHGGVTPWFWIGLKTIFSAGYNMETGAGGFRNYGGNNNTYASFNFAFVDSHYGTPLFFEVPKDLDPEAWTGHFKVINFTSKINSWEDGLTGVENNIPAWLAEISGKGMRIGFFTQAGVLRGALDDPNNTDTNTNATTPARITGGNKVLPLKDDELGKNYYDSTSTAIAESTSYTGTASLFVGYEKPELFNVFLTMLSEGDVNSDTSKGTDGKPKNDGFAGVIDFGVSPFGLITDYEKPFTYNITGNAITGFNYESTTKENIGFGLKAETGFWLGQDNLVLSPAAAFDGRIDVDNKFTWKIGGGLTFQFSGMRWVNDDWGELEYLSNSNTRYENQKILKYAYGQVYAAYSETNDLDIVFKVEEPDGDVGFHDKLGAMAEFRMFNLTGKVTTNKLDWMTQGRVSYDINLGTIPATPSLRAYLDSDAILKLRLGIEANVIPYTSFALAYTSANLNRGAPAAFRAMSSNKSYTSNFDAGRIELIVILQSDAVRPRLPKRMGEWNYPASLSEDSLR
jgi:hypothetical protein